MFSHLCTLASDLATNDLIHVSTFSTRFRLYSCLKFAPCSQWKTSTWILTDLADNGTCSTVAPLVALDVLLFWELLNSRCGGFFSAVSNPLEEKTTGQSDVTWQVVMFFLFSFGLKTPTFKDGGDSRSPLGIFFLVVKPLCCLANLGQADFGSPKTPWLQWCAQKSCLIRPY